MTKMMPRKFRNVVYAHYKKYGRHTLPWRKTTNPYHILVSEVMLQQTQVDRVIPYFEDFLRRFPRTQSLAEAPLGDVLRVWQGLGYNRRAKMLHECAKVVMEKYHGRMPKTYEELLSLPGVGPYTAAAVMAFAHDTAVPLIETNVRAALIHHFFPNRRKIHDRELMPLVLSTLDMEHPRAWYSALMDYGAHIKRTEGNAARRSAHHVKQSTFAGSDRQVRGAILRALIVKPMTIDALTHTVGHTKTRLRVHIQNLIREGLVAKVGQRFMLP